MRSSSQVMEHADTAFYMGMIDMSQRVQISVMQLRTAQLIADGQFTPPIASPT